jgi:hypothetical protein
MKRRSRYADEVIAYVLAKRAKNVKWNEIKEGIKQEFGLKPPSERQMRDWFHELGGAASDPDRILRERLVQVTKATTPFAIFSAQKLLFEQGIPELVKAWGQGEDPWIAGGTMLLSMLEQTVGSETYNKIIKQYEQIREQRAEKLEGLKDQQNHLGPGLPPGWVRKAETGKEPEK